MSTSLSTYGPPSNTWFLRPIRAHNPNGIPTGSAVFAQTTVVSLYFTMGRPFSPKNLPLPTGDLDPHLIHGSPGPPKSSTQTAARSVQPFLQGSLVWQTDRATRSVRIGRIYVRSTAMQPKNWDAQKKWSSNKVRGVGDGRRGRSGHGRHATVSASQEQTLSSRGARVYTAHRGRLGVVTGISAASTGELSSIERTSE